MLARIMLAGEEEATIDMLIASKGDHVLVHRKGIERGTTTCMRNVVGRLTTNLYANWFGGTTENLYAKCSKKGDHNPVCKMFKNVDHKPKCLNLCEMVLKG